MNKSTADKKRCLAKALTWRFTASAHTFLLGWLLTGRIEVGATIGVIELFTKTALYYFHERAWDQTTWATNRNALDTATASKVN